MQSMKVEEEDWEMEEKRKERKLFWSQRNKTGFYYLPSASRCSGGHGGGDGPTAARRFASVNRKTCGHHFSQVSLGGEFGWD